MTPADELAERLRIVRDRYWRACGLLEACVSEAYPGGWAALKEEITRFLDDGPTTAESRARQSGHSTPEETIDWPRHRRRPGERDTDPE